MEHETLATELLRELKASSRRWFIAFCVMLVIELLTITGFMLYINHSSKDESVIYNQNVEDLQNFTDSTLTQTIGGDKDD